MAAGISIDRRALKLLAWSSQSYVLLMRRRQREVVEDCVAAEYLLGFTVDDTVSATIVARGIAVEARACGKLRKRRSSERRKAKGSRRFGRRSQLKPSTTSTGRKAALAAAAPRPASAPA
ncbi:MAG: hypothetical protein HZA66_04130 [Rhodopseudomonas palustris]|uniref:Uncharacterized protein n=1 Tax=Rhodopseudomonas palustris TaxID=1076 RepID=A0A933RUS9_RHOPL|nr:hypothetical protein [Rhodopseudomonas palustris]